MAEDEDRTRLAQNEMLNWLTRRLQPTEMVTVYLSDHDQLHDYGIYCALIPSSQIDRTLSEPSWDLMHGQGLPGTVEYYDDGVSRIDYVRFGDDTGVEPLIIDREFYGMRDDYKEICEEFRLFHRLYHDRKLDHYIKFDDAGNDHLIAIVEENKVQIRLKEIREFLAIKEMHLSIQFDCRESSKYSLEELNLKEGGNDQRENLACWSLGYGDLGGIGSHRAFSRLLGIRLIDPLPKQKSGFWGFGEDQKKKYVEFIIGVDDEGNEILHTSDPDALANNFGANPDAPHYLTAVHFRKQVLDKYFQQPGKYSVADARLWCGSLWSMCLDNHHDDKVCAWLGDLGRDLPYEEQLHWRSYNIPPSGQMSETFVRRQLLAQSTDSDRPEHLFHRKYRKLAEACEDFLGWQLLLPLDKDDEHHFQCVRIPATDEQRDFDELVLGLSKILIDSLNERQLMKMVPAGQRDDLKGSINRLEAALVACGIPDHGECIAFLRGLQKLRSSSAAHRKGENYRKIAAEFDVDSQSLRTVFAGVLRQALTQFDFLIGVVRSGQLKPSNDSGK